MTAEPHVPNTAPKVHDWYADRGNLTAAQARRLSAVGKDIRARYPKVDQRDLAWAAFEMAFHVLVDDPEQVVAQYGQLLRDALARERRCRAALHQAALMLVESNTEPVRVERPKGVRTQSGFADASGIDRSTVNGWMRKVGRTVRRVTSRVR